MKNTANISKIFKLSDDNATLTAPMSFDERVIRNYLNAFDFFIFSLGFSFVFNPNYGMIAAYTAFFIGFVLLTALLFANVRKQIDFNAEYSEMLFHSYPIKYLSYSDVKYIYVTERLNVSLLREIRIITNDDNEIALLSLNSDNLFAEDFYSINDLNIIAQSLSEIMRCTFIKGESQTEIAFNNNTFEYKKILANKNINKIEIDEKYKSLNFILVPFLLFISLGCLSEPISALFEIFKSSFSLSSTKETPIFNKDTYDKIKRIIDKKNYKANMTREEPIDEEELNKIRAKKISD